MAKICPKCGNTLADDGKFCSKCGCNFDAAPVCAKCGQTLSVGARFCLNCGADQTPVQNEMSGKDPASGKTKPPLLCLTVKIALGAILLICVSAFLPWLSNEDLSQSLMENILIGFPENIVIPAMLIVGILWISVWFLLNHPKLTLVGVLPLLVIWRGFLWAASESGLALSVGFFLYTIMAIVCIVTSFLTKKQKKDISGANM